MQSFDNKKFMESDVALYGMFISVALVMSYIEAIIPIKPPVPGMKLGLANIIVIWVMYAMGIKAFFSEVFTVCFLALQERHSV